MSSNIANLETDVRYHREWSHPSVFDGAWFRHSRSGANAHTSGVPFGIGGGYETEAEAWAEGPPDRWSDTRVVKITTMQLVEPIPEQQVTVQ